MQVWWESSQFHSGNIYCRTTVSSTVLDRCLRIQGRMIMRSSLRPDSLVRKRNIWRENFSKMCRMPWCRCAPGVKAEEGFMSRTRYFKGKIRSDWIDSGWLSSGPFDQEEVFCLQTKKEFCLSFPIDSKALGYPAAHWPLLWWRRPSFEFIPDWIITVLCSASWECPFKLLSVCLFVYLSFYCENK